MAGDLAGYEAEPAEVAATVEEEISAVAAGWPGDPLPRYAALSARQAYYQAVAAELARARAAVLADMHHKGMPYAKIETSYAKIGELIGLSRSRVQQLVEKGRSIAETGEFDLLVRP